MDDRADYLRYQQDRNRNGLVRPVVRRDAFLGEPVQDVMISWDTLSIGPAVRADGEIVGQPYDVDVPTALRVAFDGSSVWFVAGMPQFPEMKNVFIPGDEVMVVFEAATRSVDRARRERGSRWGLRRDGPRSPIDREWP